MTPKDKFTDQEFFRVVRVEELDSTNECLLRSDLEIYPLGTALLAATQSQGRGRHQREWLSEPGGMFLSVLFLPTQVEALSLLGAYAVVRLCCEEFGLEPLLRWPNDIYVGGRKLAGVLPQVRFAGSRIEKAVLGVGLNVNQELDRFPEELKSRVTTLSELLGEPLDLNAVVSSFLEKLSYELTGYLENGPEPLLKKCEPHLEGLIQRKTAYAMGVGGKRRPLGKVCGLGPAGELKVDDGHLVINLGSTERLVFE